MVMRAALGLTMVTRSPGAIPAASSQRPMPRARAASSAKLTRPRSPATPGSSTSAVRSPKSSERSRKSPMTRGTCMEPP